MKSFKKEFFTIVLLLVVALVGTYVVNAAPTTQPSPDHESVSQDATAVYQPLALIFHEESTHGVFVDEFLLAVDYSMCGNNNHGACTSFCNGTNIPSEWENTCYDSCIAHCNRE